jgi:hypothetical protein
MGPAVLFFLVLVAGAPSGLLSGQTLDGYPMAVPSTTWINYDGLEGRSIGDCLGADPSLRLLICAGFYCVSTISPCDGFLFAVSIEIEGLSTQEIVWSANPDRPVRENATLEFTADGNLVLRDADASHVWSSNSTGRSVAGMIITEIGNLVLFDHRNATVWQSFNYPTDTLVLGQSLLEGMRLTASTSATNTTRSQFYITVGPDGLYAFVDSTPPQLYFSDPMEQNKRGHYATKVTFMNGSLTTFGQPWPGNFTLPTAVSTTQYMRLDSDGYLRLYEWSWSNQFWAMVYDVLSTQMDVCDYPTVCGEYGICTEGQCGCPLEYNSSSSYFKLVDERKPNLGCSQITPISCKEMRHHRLLSIPDISYFDDSHTALDATSINDCKQACLKNCSCMAVFFTHYYN